MKKIFLYLFAITLTSCSNTDNHAQNSKESKIASIAQESFKLDTFSLLPREIDGCGCYFYTSENNEQESKFIFVNDFASIAFISINGQLERFKLTEHKENSSVYLYTNSSFRLTVTITQKKSAGEEISKVKGILTVKRGDEEIKVNFIGSCGC
jgi:hypothetical protein